MCTGRVVAWRFAWLFAVLLVGCRFDGAGPNGNAIDGPCLGLICDCRDTDVCAPQCALAGCFLACERLDACDATCGDRCAPACSAAGDCDLTCGDACAARCEATGDCTVTCGHDCDVVCGDTGTCRVAMLDGAVRCNRTGTCEVECIGVDGQRRPPRAAPDGRWVCDPEGV